MLITADSILTSRRAMLLVAMPLLAFLLVATALSRTVEARSKNGFDLDNASIPIAEIRSGGPPRDGIPSIDNPRFLEVAEARYLTDADRVLGVVVNGESRAYPIRILNWHEIVNDVIGTQHIVVTYCPLCGSGMIFASNFGEGRLVFGVSGLLFNSDMLLYDRNTESLWSQIMSEAVSGRLLGTRLPQLPATHTTWADWRSQYPQTTVLSNKTGHRRDYRTSPYGDYDRSRRLMFRVSNDAPEDYHPKALVLGVEIGGMVKAYPFDELSANGETSFIDEVGDLTLTIHWDPGSHSASVSDTEGNAIASTLVYWFAWYAFYPDTLVFKNR